MAADLTRFCDKVNFKTMIKIDFTSLMYHVSTQHQQKIIFVELTLENYKGAAHEEF